jgi:hypothetical protein
LCGACFAGFTYVEWLALPRNERWIVFLLEDGVDRRMCPCCDNPMAIDAGSASYEPLTIDQGVIRALKAWKAAG